jgi:hypothetical protein
MRTPGTCACRESYPVRVAANIWESLFKDSRLAVSKH